jgi:acetyltransferase-like isoleucine patch superfamily enzyme
LKYRDYDNGMLPLQKGLDVVVSEHVDIRRPELLVLGNHVAIDSFFVCTTQLVVKDYVHLGPFISIIGGKDAYCEIGNFSGMAAGCRIVCASDEYQGEGIVNPFIPAQYRDNVICEQVVLEDFVTLGTNVIVLPGVRIAQGTVVSAGSIVTKNTQPWCVYAGTPARPIKERSKEKMLRYAKELGYDIG